MKNLILILWLSSFCHAAAYGQDAIGNRMKVIHMLLEHTHLKISTDHHHADIYDLMPTSRSEGQGFKAGVSIPRYCLAKGAVICRLEEYVQLHSPFKLNIGLGGE